MSQGLPERVDAARQVQARRRYEGTIPLAAFRRLRDSLASAEGEARCVAEFGRDELGTAVLDVAIEALLPLTCQRTLKVFGFPVTIEQRLGLVRHEREEAALPAGCEPLVVGEDGQIALHEAIEDELILALPVIPMAPGAPLEWHDAEPETTNEEHRPNPFAVLGQLKQ